MGYTVRMPQLGMTMEEGVVVEWSVDEGEQFSEGDVIAVIESEKTTNDVEAREDGVIVEQFVELKEAVEPGDPIAYVGEEGEAVPDEIRAEVSGDSSVADETNEAGEVQEESAEALDGGGSAVSVAEENVSPRARSYAAEQDLDDEPLADLDGTGPDGAVIEQDVVEAVGAGAFEEGTQAPAGGAAIPSTDVDGRGIYEEREGTQIRQSVAHQMTISADQAPQVTLNRNVPVESLLDLKERLAEDRNLDFSISDFLIKAVTNALEEHPEFNAVYEDGVHKLAANINVAVAVDLDGGLVTPVLHGISDLSLAEINAARTTLVERTQAREYTGDDLADGTFTITNLGHFGVESFDPLLNVPEVGILGVNAITHEATADGGTERCIGLSLTFNHRPNDGADAARFLDTLTTELEHPLGLLTLGRGGRDTEQSEDGGTFREVDGEVEGPRQARVTSEGGMRATVQSRRFEWDVDEPEESGGDDTAPNPVEQFLGSLSSCFTLFINRIAERRDVEIDEVEVTANAGPEHDAIERIDVEVRVVTESDEQMVNRVVQTAERACYVNRVMSEELERSLSVTVERP